jgi:hypothetical protein
LAVAEAGVLVVAVTVGVLAALLLLKFPLPANLYRSLLVPVGLLLQLGR